MSKVVFSTRGGVRATVIDDHVVSEGRQPATVQSEEAFLAGRASSPPVCDGIGHRVDKKWPPLGVQTEGAGRL
jgi:hypothetical protein